MKKDPDSEGLQAAVSFYGGIEAELRRRRTLALCALAVSGAVCLGSAALCLHHVSRSRSVVYVVDRGSALMAAAASGQAQRDLEAGDHVRRLHELLFNLAPSAESQQRSLEMALHLADRSVWDWWQDRSESGYYTRLVSADISQEIRIDSVSVSLGEYPYPARVHGVVYLTRESNITAYDFESECRLREVARSQLNPHGLLAERFRVTRYESLGTRRRR